jgi:Spy/CpxP family protein refolding chaperone
MKRSKIALVAACLIGAAGLASAADTPHQPHGQGAPMPSAMRTHFFDGGAPLAHVIHRLDLTDSQRQSIRDLFEANRPQQQALRAEQREVMEASRKTLPDDPNYQALVQKRKDLAAQAIQQRSDLEVQIFALLTPEQKAKVPELAAEPRKPPRQWRGDKGRGDKGREGKWGGDKGRGANL